MINRIVLVGNGFDLAHGLKTSYKDFIDWYWEQIRIKILDNLENYSIDEKPIWTLKSNKGIRFMYTIPEDYIRLIQRAHGLQLYDIFNNVENFSAITMYTSTFFDRIMNSLETKNWVDVEYEYYILLCETLKNKETPYSINELNEQLDFIKNKLIEYLKTFKICARNEQVRRIINSPVSTKDVSVRSVNKYMEIMKRRSERNAREWHEYFENYDLDINKYKPVFTDKFQELTGEYSLSFSYEDFLLDSDLQKPDNILFVNFNYTDMLQSYINGTIFDEIHIHGTLTDPKKVIFGYGDELDENFKRIENLNDNRYLKNVKSTRYMESANYRKLMEFMNLAPYQVIIMGHSCGNSDRTLLNALFEHENCISIKPYYYKDKDGNEHYTDMVQNIYRNFTNKADFRDKVVNIEYCEPMPQV